MKVRDRDPLPCLEVAMLVEQMGGIDAVEVLSPTGIVDVGPLSWQACGEVHLHPGVVEQWSGYTVYDVRRKQ